MAAADVDKSTLRPTEVEAAAGPSARGSGVLVKLLAGAAALAALWLVGRYLGGYVPRFAAWVDTLGVWGPLVFILGYTAATVAFVPGLLLTIAAGAVFGIAQGTLYVFVGATLGSSAAFLIARYLARAAIERKLEGRPKFRAIDRAVGREGFKIVALLRLSPVFPYNLLNYGLGLTNVRFVAYLLASIAMLPGTLLYVYTGSLAGDAAAAVARGAPEQRGTAEWALLVAGLLATLVVTFFITRKARQALAQEVDDV